MRIAIAGTHFSGKTTLVHALADRLGGHHRLQEPYVYMVEGGYTFSDPPSVEDYDEQLATLSDFLSDNEDTIFDRSPLDFLAYAQSVPRGPAVNLARWRDVCEYPMSLVDVIVYCPIETPDRITVPLGESRKFRRRVDEKLRELVVEDTLDLIGDITVIEVSGSVDERVEQVLSVLATLPPPERNPELDF